MNEQARAAPSASAAQKLQDLMRQVNGARERFWDRVLTPSQRDQLGGSLREALTRHGSVLKMWLTVRSGSGELLVIRLARLLGFLTDPDVQWLLREYSLQFEDEDDALQQALNKFDLVLTEAPRRVFWMRTEIPIEWDRFSTLWDYFVVLVEASKQKRAIDSFTFGEDRPADYHVKLKSELICKQGFPTTLKPHLKSIRGGGQKLDIPAHRICILRTQTVENYTIE